jgi:tetratricopeptide (TPR) repeat protein
MLFDLRGGGRRRTVQIVYITLAILMGGGLVLFGIGGAVSGGLVDAITQNGGTTDTGVERYQQRERAAVRETQAKPNDPAAWAALARARFQLASAGENLDRNTGEFSADGRRLLRSAADAWEKHLSVAGKNPDDSVANAMVQVYGALGDAESAVRAQEVITDARPKSATFATLAILAYEAGQTRKGDLARDKAIELAPEDQRETIKAQIDEAKTAALGRAIENATPAPTPSPTATPKKK